MSYQKRSLVSNKRPDANWATEGLHFLAQIIAELRGDFPDTEYDTYDNLLTANYGAQPFENDVFIMRSYCWCDGFREGHEGGCPPNFQHSASGLVINWDKHAGRGVTSNRRPSFKGWFEIIEECVRSIKN